MIAAQCSVTERAHANRVRAVQELRAARGMRPIAGGVLEGMTDHQLVEMIDRLDRGLRPWRPTPLWRAAVKRLNAARRALGQEDLHERALRRTPVMDILRRAQELTAQADERRYWWLRD